MVCAMPSFIVLKQVPLRWKVIIWWKLKEGSPQLCWARAARALSKTRNRTPRPLAFGAGAWNQSNSGSGSASEVFGFVELDAVLAPDPGAINWQIQKRISVPGAIPKSRR